MFEHCLCGYKLMTNWEGYGRENSGILKCQVIVQNHRTKNATGELITGSFCWLVGKCVGLRLGNVKAYRKINSTFIHVSQNRFHKSVSLINSFHSVAFTNFSAKTMPAPDGSHWRLQFADYCNPRDLHFLLRFPWPPFTSWFIRAIVDLKQFATSVSVRWTSTKCLSHPWSSSQD